MTETDLLANGFKEFKPSPALYSWDNGFQLRVRDRFGTRYFINVYRWDHRKYRADAGIGWEIEVTYNDGVEFNPSRAAVQIKAWAGVETWSAKDVIAWADQLWKRLTPNHYERET